ncbi:hypothetical protein ACV34Y_33520, partial [Pseudomonas aeruginosa]
WLGLVYAFKWVWSPMLDQWRLPFVGRLGRRRSWLVFSQVLIALGLLGMALCNPQSHLPWLIGLAAILGDFQAVGVDRDVLGGGGERHQQGQA